MPDGQFPPAPAYITHESFRRLWEHMVFSLFLDEGRIEPSLAEQMRSW